MATFGKHTKLTFYMLLESWGTYCKQSCTDAAADA